MTIVKTPHPMIPRLQEMPKLEDILKQVMLNGQGLVVEFEDDKYTYMLGAWQTNYRVNDRFRNNTNISIKIQYTKKGQNGQ